MWGEWLPRTIAAADPRGVACWYLGCNGLVVTDGATTIFIDPYCGTGDPPRTRRMIPIPFDPRDVHNLDGLFVTHEHTDHVHGPTQGPLLAGTDAKFYGPEESVAVSRSNQWTDTYDIDAGQFQTVSPGDGLALGEFRISVRRAHDPDAVDPVAYVLEHPAGTLIHGGDARPHRSFTAIGEEFDIDVGFLAFGSSGVIPDKETGVPQRTTWYNDEAEIIEAAGQLRLDRLVPTHWDMWYGMQADPDALLPHAQGVEFPRRVEQVVLGDRVDVLYTPD